MSGAGACFPGHSAEAPFPGLVTGQVLLPRALPEAEVATLAAEPGLLEPVRKPR